MHHDAHGLSDLRRGAKQLVSMSTTERRELLQACVAGIERHWQAWVQAAWSAKRLPDGSPARAEDILTGPVATVRHLHLLHHTLGEIVQHGEPRLPGAVRSFDGKVSAPVFPTRSLFDRLLFGPLTARVIMPNGTAPDALFGDHLRTATGQSAP